ncbi:hypothetical protein ACVR0S_09625 [Streptococcus dentapri]|uniref:Lipoprotein n=1 Tax=Streptococcus dentapri TaxID=573564 RepID=A0ABV8CZ11_9STRE
MKRSTKITLVSLTTVAILAGIVGNLIAVRVISSRYQAFGRAKLAQDIKENEKKQREEERETKEKQLAYLKEHQQEIVDFVKSQSPKVESVQIDWDETQWDKSGVVVAEPFITVYGGINDLEDSSWSVDIWIDKDGNVDMDSMSQGNQLEIGGDPI